MYFLFAGGLGAEGHRHDKDVIDYWDTFWFEFVGIKNKYMKKEQDAMEQKY